KAHFSEAIKSFTIVGLGRKEQIPTTGLDNRGILEQRRIVTLHVAKMHEQDLRKSIPVGKSGEACKPFQLVPIRRQSVGLLVGHHLKTVFDHTQKTVSGAEIIAYVLIDPRPRGQRIERLKGRFDTQLGMTAASDELLRLDEEFDFADATAPQLDVVPLDRDFIVAAI